MVAGSIKNEQDNDSDRKAIELVLSGDLDSFKLIQNKYKKLISALVRKMIKDEDDVQDLVQETFIKAYNALSTYNPIYPFSSWLYRIASNSCIDFLRKKRFKTISLNQPNPNSEDEPFFEIEDKSTMPDINLLSEERRNALNSALAALPENLRYIIKLRHEDDMEYTQIAEHLNIPMGSVKTYLFRARKMLLSSLKKDKHLFM
jgi:RNA polymerase sigma factor (sigma-70 family)